MAPPPVAPRLASEGTSRTGGRLSSALVWCLGICSLVSASVNLIHVHSMAGGEIQQNDMNHAVARAINEFSAGYKRTEELKKHETEEDEIGLIPHNVPDQVKQALEPKDGAQATSVAATQSSVRRTKSKLAGLNCDAFGGPPQDIVEEMVYWSDIESDSAFVSPFHAKHGEHRRYMTFEPDGGGWNNIRMAMETVVGLAVAMGRTLVLPPEQGMYLLRKGDSKQRRQFSFAHFFPMLEMAEEHRGLEVITTEQFLEAEAMAGNLVDKNTGEPSFPPENRTSWDGQDVKILKEWLRNVTHTPEWRPGACLAAFPASTGKRDMLKLQRMQLEIHQAGVKPDTFVDNPVAANGSAIDRMHENMAGRKDLCLYDEQMQGQLVVHFMCYHKMRIRLLVHFYAFLYFEDWRMDLWMKRFVRDHLRYVDEIQCAAARVVHAVRERSRQRNPVGNGDYDSFHIRRGDFQFKKTRLPAEEIYGNSQEWLTPNKTVYIATDERNKTFFQPLKDHYDVVFLDDFMHLLEGVNTNYYGMMDQLIASRGNIFIGCWFSTFTGYITRLRGYRSQKDKLSGYERGLLPTTFYYATTDRKFEMHKYVPVRGGFFNREFPTSWRDIDRGIGELPVYGL